MSTAKFVEVHVDDVVRLRKAHPCGSTDWTVVRLGADIGLRCERCEHRVLLPRRLFERRLEALLSRAVQIEPTAAAEWAGGRARPAQANDLVASSPPRRR